MTQWVKQNRKPVKVITYGVMHMSVAILVAYLLSGSWAVALSIGLLEPLVQTGCYHLHETLWGKVPAGVETVQTISAA